MKIQLSNITHYLLAILLVSCSILDVSVQAQTPGGNDTRIVVKSGSDKLAAEGLKQLDLKNHAQAVELLTKAISSYRAGSGVKLETLYGMRGSAYLALTTSGGTRIDKIDPNILNLAKADLDRTVGGNTNGISFDKTHAIVNQLLALPTNSAVKRQPPQSQQPVATQAPVPASRPTTSQPTQVTVLPKNASTQQQPFSKVVQFSSSDITRPDPKFYSIRTNYRFVRVKAGPLKVELIGSPKYVENYLIGTWPNVGERCVVRAVQYGFPGPILPYVAECIIPEDTVALLKISSSISDIFVGRFTSNGMRPLTQEEMKEYYPTFIPKKVTEGSVCSNDYIFGATNCKTIRTETPEY